MRKESFRENPPGRRGFLHFKTLQNNDLRLDNFCASGCLLRIQRMWREGFFPCVHTCRHLGSSIDAPGAAPLASPLTNTALPPAYVRPKHVVSARPGVGGESPPLVSPGFPVTRRRCRQRRSRCVSARSVPSRDRSPRIRAVRLLQVEHAVRPQVGAWNRWLPRCTLVVFSRLGRQVRLSPTPAPSFAKARAQVSEGRHRQACSHECSIAPGSVLSRAGSSRRPTRPEARPAPPWWCSASRSSCSSSRSRRRRHARWGRRA